MRKGYRPFVATVKHDFVTHVEADSLQDAMMSMKARNPGAVIEVRENEALPSWEEWAEQFPDEAAAEETDEYDSCELYLTYLSKLRRA